ncbi:MAG TPA: rod shape-determining protein MreD, partial [Solirubrobacteraceae bacterium]|nr:rod shape-determining protein MreD [Solirubrobacteraceae bacterium]
MSSTSSASLPLRLAAMAVVVAFVQVGVVSEIPVLGVNADLSPLLVAFVGLLCGSTVGATYGFATGLLVDLLLLQTLGLSSLIFTLVG